MKPNPNLIREKMIQTSWLLSLGINQFGWEEDNFSLDTTRTRWFKNKKRKVKSGLKVMRISDGKIYDSVKLCRDENGFYSDSNDWKTK
jgi:hypothetical protein